MACAQKRAKFGLDENCGSNGWAMTPSGVRGVLNDAVSLYFTDATLASAFIARWCAGSKVETAGLEAPPGIGAVQTFSGRRITIGEDRIVEMSAEDANCLIRAGWTKLAEWSADAAG
jgi:hypothetical protein